MIDIERYDYFIEYGLEDIEEQYKKVLPFLFSTSKYTYLIEKLTEVDYKILMSHNNMIVQEELEKFNDF